MSSPGADRAQTPTPLPPRPVENDIETGRPTAPGGGEAASCGPECGGAASRAGEAAGAVIILILGILLGALVLTGRSHHYVQPLLTPVLGLTAALLLALAAWSLWATADSRRRGPGAHRPRQPEAPGGAAGDHGGGGSGVSFPGPGGQAPPPPPRAGPRGGRE